jgi:hypothetical protein
VYWHDGGYWRWLWLDKVRGPVIRAACIIMLAIGLTAVAYGLVEAGSP